MRDEQDREGERIQAQVLMMTLRMMMMLMMMIRMVMTGSLYILEGHDDIDDDNLMSKL